ncbi:MAG: aminomethyl-transferring glycine dehydrogenase subunit GcvPA [Candidatus Neomarinimicrobiota bacterium]
MSTTKSSSKPNQFVPYTSDLEEELLREMGLNSFGDLIQVIPRDLRLDGGLPLPRGKSEPDIVREMKFTAGRNSTSEQLISFLGGGSYDHFVPEAVSYLSSRAEFSTSYTPYQAEVSQGTLQAIYEYQTMICEITAMEVANASLYDGASAVAEACLLARRVNGRPVVLVSDGLYSEYRMVLETYTRYSPLKVESIPLNSGVTDMDWLRDRNDDDVSAVVIQSPNRLGLMESWREAGRIVSGLPALFVAVGDPISFGMFAPPGECGADVYAGEGQGLGSYVSFGGPYLGLLATRMEYVRKVPGRLVGEAKDIEGKPGFVLALQTREQHIRRDRATSNICTNQGLVALKAAIYLALLGKEGFKKVANLCFQKSHYASRKILEIPGFSLPYGDRFFQEFVVKCPVPVETLLAEGLRKGLLVGTPVKDDSHLLMIAVTEQRSKEDIDSLVSFLKGNK